MSRPEHSLPRLFPVTSTGTLNAADNGLYTGVNTIVGHTYRLQATVKTAGLTGTGDYGVRLWVAGNGASGMISNALADSSNAPGGWATISTEFVAQYSNHTISIGLINCTGGTAYCAQLSMMEDLGNGQFGPELVDRSDFQAHAHYPQRVAYMIDDQLETAVQSGIYVKAVITEKNDLYFGSIQADGYSGALGRTTTSTLTLRTPVGCISNTIGDT